MPLDWNAILSRRFSSKPPFKRNSLSESLRPHEFAVSHDSQISFSPGAVFEYNELICISLQSILIDIAKFCTPGGVTHEAHL